MIKIAVDADGDKRIDRVVRKELNYCTLGEIFRLFRTQKILINGKKCKESDRVSSGDEITIFADESELKRKAFRIIHEDDNLLVCDKPAGVACQPGKGIASGTSLIELAQNGKYVPNLIHRIDQDTSGIVMIAKNLEFLRKIQNIWKNVKKEYLAVCHGIFEKKTGLLELNLEKDGLIMNVVESGGKHSVSRFKVLADSDNGMSLVSVMIETGRMHQIRAQLTHIGHGIVGDRKYGYDTSKTVNRLMLHSHKVSFSMGKKQYDFEAKIPDAFGEFIHSR